MTRYKNDYEKLSPTEQLSIDAMSDRAEPQELIEAYKEVKAKETLKKRPMSAGEVFGIVIIIGCILFILFSVGINLDMYRGALKSAGPVICKANNSTFINMEERSWSSIKIICSDLTIKLP